MNQFWTLQLYTVRQYKTVSLKNFCVSAMVRRISAKLSDLYVSIHTTYLANFVDAIDTVQRI